MGTYGYAAPLYVMTGHLTSRSDVYSFGVVLLEMLAGRRSMDKTDEMGSITLWNGLGRILERDKGFTNLDPRLEGRFSIKGAQKAIQLAAHCLSRDRKARPLMSEVVEVLKPLPILNDMACCSSHFQAMGAERAGSIANARNGGRLQGGFPSRNVRPTRSILTPNVPYVSPYNHYHLPRSPKP